MTCNLQNGWYYLSCFYIGGIVVLALSLEVYAIATDDLARIGGSNTGRDHMYLDARYDE